MKLLSLLLCLISAACFAQNTKVFKSVWVPEKGVYELKELTRVKEYTITDGTTISYNTNAQDDTARVYNYGNKTYTKTIIFNEVGTSSPIPDCPECPACPGGTPVNRDDHATSITYTGTWSKANNLSWTQVFHDKTVSYSTTAGAKAETTFTGTRYEIWSEKRNNHGNTEVWQKKGSGANTKVADVNLYDATITSGNNSTKVYDSGVLPLDTYVIQFIRNEANAGRDITLDKIVVYP